VNAGPDDDPPVPILRTRSFSEREAMQISPIQVAETHARNSKRNKHEPERFRTSEGRTQYTRRRH
jgi:hypothetical protein